MIKVTDVNMRVNYIAADQIQSAEAFDDKGGAKLIMLGWTEGYLRVAEDVVDVLRMIRADRKFGDDYDFISVNRHGVVQGSRRGQVTSL